MPEETNENAGSSVNINLGKEIDAAMGDLIRAALLKPATVFGDLTSDYIGILADRVKLKREMNAKLGLEEVRRRLEKNNVDMSSISSPKEEEFHLLISGLSLADDALVRRIWAGLFAESLRPSSGVSAERPYISVLQALSPLDAKIFEFLTYAFKLNQAAHEKVNNISHHEIKEGTDNQEEWIERVNGKIAAIRESTKLDIFDKAEQYHIAELRGSAWADNLVRHGVIEKVPMIRRHVGRLQFSTNKYKNEMGYINALGRHIEEMSEEVIHNSTPTDGLFKEGSKELTVRLTNFGIRLAKACDLFG